MNYVDGALLLVLLISAWSGYKRGFVFSAADLVKWLGSMVASFALYPYLSKFLLYLYPSLGVLATPLGFIIALILFRILFSFILSAFTRHATKEVHTSATNKLMGILPGFINGVITIAILALLLLSFPVWQNLSNETRESKIVTRLTAPAQWIEDQLSPVFNDAVHQTLTKLTVEPGSEETVNLPYTKKNTDIRPDLEARMLVLVNEERAKKNLPPLAADNELRYVARAHSKDMFARGYFSHFTPEGKDPFDRMKQAGIKYRAAGENLALAQTLHIAHTGLMNSPGHRANILNAAFGRVGIGIQDGGIYGLMISQEFRN